MTMRGSLSCVVVFAASVLACQPYAELKARYFTPWTHLAAGTGGLADPLTGACHLPVHSDDYYGFTIGYPSGWEIDYSTGALVVARDEQQMVGALVFPARLRRADVTPDQLADVFIDSLARRARAAGGSLELADKTTDGVIATATVHATVSDVALQGVLQVVERPGFATLKLYWAPQAELAEDEPTLKQVVTCFQRKTIVTARQPVAPDGGPKLHVGGHAGAATAGNAASASGGAGSNVQPLHAYRGKYFALDMPAGWVVRDETPHGIDIASANGHEALGFGWWIGPAQRPDVVLMRGVQQLYPGVQVLQSGFPQAPPGWSVAAAEFEGQSHGIPTHGFSRCAIGDGVALSSSWVTGPDQWAALAPTLQAVAASVQILPTAVAQVQAGIRRQLASYPPIKRSTAGTSSHSASGSSHAAGGIGGWDDNQATKDRIQQGWSDSMLQQDRAVSPTTGEEYVVPTNAWNDSGPQGAGYYRAVPGGGAERLNVEDNYGNAQ